MLYKLQALKINKVFVHFLRLALIKITIEAPRSKVILDASNLLCKDVLQVR